MDPSLSKTSPLTSCEINYRKAYLQLQPDIERMGLSMRYTANIGDGPVLCDGQLLQDRHGLAHHAARFNGTPTSPNPAGLSSYNVMLPVYVCSTGVGTSTA